MYKSTADNFGNTANITTAKIKNEVDKAIRMINSNTGYGQIVLSMFDKKVTNIKVTISTDIK